MQGMLVLRMILVDKLDTIRLWATLAMSKLQEIIQETLEQRTRFRAKWEPMQVLATLKRLQLVLTQVALVQGTRLTSAEEIAVQQMKGQLF
ncbi:uncharacterized protein [Thunnus thynnus]|uniref:uncharacterized protein isoform X4 n=1 Tax=Thunnus thynnus TaxID=8237 RepID=UPI003527E97A